MRVCYFIQNHLGPAQVSRLIGAIRVGASNPFFLIAHDSSAGHCSASQLRNTLPGVDVFEPAEPPRRGYFSMLQPWFEAVSWLSSHQVEYDWLVYLSAQDYPTQPINRFERMLASTEYDGFLRFWDARALYTPWGRRKQGIYRYFYQYFDAPEWLRPALPFVRRLNRFQRLMHTHLIFGPRVGFRISRSPFDSSYVCYSGKQWTVLTRECAEYALHESARNQRVIQWFRGTVCPDEAVVQTLLVNESRFQLKNDELRYVDFSESRDGHPRTLTTADLPTITDSAIWFARKIDTAVDPNLPDRLDEWIANPGPNEERSPLPAWEE